MNLLKSFKIQSCIEISAAVSQVWNIFIEFKSYSEWNPFITKIEGIPKRFEILNMTIRCPGMISFRFQPRVSKVIPSAELSWRGAFFSRTFGQATHQFRVQKIDDHTTQFIQKSDISGLWVPGLHVYFGEKFREGFRLMNQALKQQVENQLG